MDPAPPSLLYSKDFWIPLKQNASEVGNEAVDLIRAKRKPSLAFV